MDTPPEKSKRGRKKKRKRSIQYALDGLAKKRAADKKARLLVEAEKAAAHVLQVQDSAGASVTGKKTRLSADARIRAAHALLVQGNAGAGAIAAAAGAGDGTIMGDGVSASYISIGKKTKKDDPS